VKISPLKAAAKQVSSEGKVVVWVWCRLINFMLA